MSKPVIVIGSGMAAYLFAKEFRQYDKERPLILLTKVDGRFYSKPLLSTALTHKKSIEDLALSDAAAMSQKLSADIITHAQVIAINPVKKSIVYQDAEGEHSLEYGDLVMACGADKIRPPLEGDGVDGVHSVNNIEDYEAFREWLEGKKHIGIIGAGFVGSEFANDLINCGYEVTVMASVSHPLARLMPKEVGSVLADALTEKGVRWVLGRYAKRVDRDDKAYRVILDDGSEVRVDGVMSAIGLRPHLALAKSAGLETNIGVVVNSQLQSSDPHIYALGDCAEVNGEVLQYVAPLLQCARVLAKVLTQEVGSLQYPIMPVVIKTPACPAVIVPPPKALEGQWHYEGEGHDRKALFKDSNGKLRGFVLLGNTTREKAALVKILESEKAS